MATSHEVRKAVIPCAGFGTRFLPMTKASPKEMLPIVDKPVIQYIVEEAVASGITEIVLITGSNKRAIEDHFDYNFELEEILKRAGKIEQYNEIRAISDLAKFVYIRQKEQLGNGHAILQAKEVIGDEPFVVLYGDDLFKANPPRTKQLIDTYMTHGGAVLGCITTTDPEAPYKYGIVSGEKVAEHDIKVERLIEKPGAEAAPPFFANVAGLLLPSSIFPILEHLPAGKSGEIWLTDAVRELMKTEAVYAHALQDALYYDCGNKVEYIKANIDYALERGDMGSHLIEYLEKAIRK